MREKRIAILRRERQVQVILMSVLLISSTCIVAKAEVQADAEPNAIELVRAVYQSEDWIHRIDSLRFRAEGTWSHSPESIVARQAELKKQYPDKEPDPERNWSLKPSFGDRLEYAIDFRRQRLRYVDNTPGRDYFERVRDGHRTICYSKAPDGYQQYTVDVTIKMLETLFGSLSWPEARPHSFWWAPRDVSKIKPVFNSENGFDITGRASYRGVECYVVKLTLHQGDRVLVWTWYVGVEDHLLYGHTTGGFEYWTLDYREVAPNCWMPLTQGYNIPGYDREKKRSFVEVCREVKLMDVQVNEMLDDELFHMEFIEGISVHDVQAGTWHKYKAEHCSLMGEALAKLNDLGLGSFKTQIMGKALLVCFFDMQQRPSRHSLFDLARQAKTLDEKGVTVVAVQTPSIDKTLLDAWVEDNAIPFLFGMIQGEENKARLAWGVEALPWLILTDEKHIVTGEGLSVEEVLGLSLSKKNGQRLFSVTNNEQRITDNPLLSKGI